jgi:hypothetical protein
MTGTTKEKVKNKKVKRQFLPNAESNRLGRKTLPTALAHFLPFTKCRSHGVNHDQLSARLLKQ